MARLKTTVLKDGRRWHNWLSWTGGLALLLFALSGMTHQIMTWTGPRAAAFFPPQAVIQADLAAQIPQTLERAGITDAYMVKVVPAPDEYGVVLQVTQSPDQPRRYFDLSTQTELADYDETYAVWLARYYTGSPADIKSITFQNTFDDAYPWVNRLLPVYKVSFDTPDNLEAFVYTELGALGSLTNDWKTTLQGIFQFVHTWSWLDGVENARVFLMMALLLSLFGMVATGTAMVFLMKNRKMEKKRKAHRYIAYVIWLPLLGFSASGMYHLLQYSYAPNTHEPLQMSAPISLATGTQSLGWLDQYSEVSLNGLSLVKAPSGDLVYRLSLPQGRHGQPVEKQKRFDGVPIEKAALYFDASTGDEVAVTDRDMALHYAQKHSGLTDVMDTSLVTSFGPDYDFRNKRLPVWRISYADDTLFIDPASGMLVDRTTTAQKRENISFANLHKWSFLTPLVGRMPRDAIMVVVLSMAVVSTLFGYAMVIRRKRKR